MKVAKPNSNEQAMNQKQAVYSAVQHIMGADSFEGKDLNRTITSEQRRQVVDLLMEGFKDGVITLNTQFPSDQALRTYCTGLLSNWLRKDTRLNGGTPYTPKHSRGVVTGSIAGDTQLKALNNLLAQVTDEEERKEIQGYIEARKAELAPSRSFKNVDFDALPEGLRQKFQSPGVA